MKIHKLFYCGFAVSMCGLFVAMQPSEFSSGICTIGFIACWCGALGMTVGISK